MSTDVSKLLEQTTPLATAFMIAVREVASKLQEFELLQQKERKREEEELESRSAALTKLEESLKQECINLEQKKKELSKAEDDFKQQCRKFESDMAEREKHLKQQKNDYDEMQRRMRAAFGDSEQQVIQIDVGGKTYKTYCKTLCRFADSALAQVVQAKLPTKDHPETVFIDRDAQYFDLILNYLRNGDEESAINTVSKYSPNEILDILEEAKYYNLRQLVRVLKWALVRCDGIAQDNDALFVTATGGCHVTKEPPSGEDVNLRKMNFTDRRFEQVHFKHNTSFEGSVLQRAVFSKCKFEAAVSFVETDLRKAKFVDCEFSVPVLVTGAIKKDAVLPAGNTRE